MSLVPTYVKLSDGLWYKNPVLYGETWYLCFDDDDPPELVVQQLGQLSKQDRQLTIKNILDYHNIPVRSFVHSVCGQRLYPPNYKGFKKSINAFLKISGTFGFDKCKLKHDGQFDQRPIVDCVYYEWK